MKYMKTTVYSLMNRFRHVLLLGALSLSLLPAHAQVFNFYTIPSVANGNSGSGRGPINTTLFHRSAAVYKASEILPFLSAGDTIGRLGWSILTAGGSVSGTMKIYLVNTSDVTYSRSTTWSTLLTTPTAMTQVYNGSMTIPGTVSNYTVLLSTPFVYTGGGLYVAYDWAPTTTSGTAVIYNCNTDVTLGQWNAQGTTLPTTLNSNSTFRAQVVFGIVPKKLDASVDELYSLGKLPIPYANPHVVRTRVTNNGKDTLFNWPVTLNVTGANTFTNTQTIDTLKPGGNFKFVDFAGFSPANTGSNLLTVSVPADSVNSNNSRTFHQTVNLNSYSYADPTIASAGGVGFTGATGDFVAKFPYTGVNQINQIGVNFFAGGQTVKVGIWDTSAAGTPGTLLWSSAAFTAATGVNTIPVNPKVAITGSFFVGVIQFNSANANFAFQNENPIRNKTFYYTSPTGNTVWTDFNATNSAFRFMIEPRLELANDVGVTDKLAPCAAIVQNSAPFAPQARIYNFGNISQFTPFYVKYRITGPVNYFDSVTTTVTSGASADVTFPNTFNPTVAGTYTVKIYTELPGDGDQTNDTITTTFVINSLNLGNTAVNKLAFDAVDDYLTVPDASSLNPNLGLTLEGWITPSSFTTNRVIFSKDASKAVAGREYTLYLNTGGFPVFVIQTSAGVDSLVGTRALTSGLTTHLAATYDGTLNAMNIYINGDTAGTKFFFGNFVSVAAPLSIGRFQGGSEFFLGSMDELKIWNVARTADQIRTGLHTRLANISSANLVMYLRLDEGVNNNIVTDASGNCNSALLNNMDFNNLTTPAWVVSQIPLGTPNVNKQTVNGTGSNTSATFTGTKALMNFYNYNGTEDYVVHQFATQPLGTLPSTTPGGVTNVHNNFWVIYKYGSATYDSIRTRFSFTGGNLLASSAVASDIVLFRRSNGESAGWTSLGTAAAISVPSQYAEFNTNGPVFGQQFSAGGNNNSLPVKLIVLSARKSGKDVVIDWTTASEENNSHFDIERSSNNKDFTSIGRVAGAGNSNEVKNYVFIDQDAASLNANVVYYRLKQVDMDGRFTYTNIVLVNYNPKVDNGSTVLPNPFDRYLTVSFNSAVTEPVHVKVIDMNGRTVIDRMIEATPGTNTYTLDEAANLTAGIYYVSFALGDQVTMHKVIKLKD